MHIRSCFSQVIVPSRLDAKKKPRSLPPLDFVGPLECVCDLQNVFCYLTILQIEFRLFKSSSPIDHQALSGDLKADVSDSFRQAVWEAVKETVGRMSPYERCVQGNAGALLQNRMSFLLMADIMKFVSCVALDASLTFL